LSATSACDLLSLSSHSQSAVTIEAEAVLPDDPYYASQWNLSAVSIGEAWGLIDAYAKTDQAVVVAVIDTGIVFDHPDLLHAPVASGYDFVSDPATSGDGDGIDDDPTDPGNSRVFGNSWHGTHVAGIIAADSDNDLGIAGIGLNHLLLLPVRVLGTDGGTTYDVAQGILYAAGLANDSPGVPDRSARVINLSLGTSQPDPFLESVLSDVADRGICIVCAAGNDGGPIVYPAAYGTTVAVTATTIENEPAPYSNSGPEAELAAPGGDTSTDLDGNGEGDGVLGPVKLPLGGGGYAYYQGTSMAAPHVSGVLGLMLLANPDATPAMLRGYLSRSALDLGPAGKDAGLGYGLVQAADAVTLALEEGLLGSTTHTEYWVEEASVDQGSLALDASGRGYETVVIRLSDSFTELAERERRAFWDRHARKWGFDGPVQGNPRYARILVPERMDAQRMIDALRADPLVDIVHHERHYDPM
jgi:serine protease